MLAQTTGTTQTTGTGPVPQNRVVVTTTSQAAAVADIVKRFQPPPATGKPGPQTARVPVVAPKNLSGMSTNSGSAAAVDNSQTGQQAIPATPVISETSTTRTQPQHASLGTKDVRLLRVRALVSGGALRLAITTLERFQQASTAVADWWLLEQDRLQILNQLQDWQAIVARSTHPQAGLAPKFLQMLNDWQVMARLKLHQGTEARQVLRQLLWVEHPLPPALSRAWRRQLIRSYLVAGEYGDAKISALRYQQEYFPTDPAWTYLFARVLLAADDPGLALQWLRANQTYEGRLLRLQAQLMSDSKPGLIQADANKLMQQLPANRLQLRRELWSVIAAAAAKSSDDIGQLEALEQALSIPPKSADYLLTNPSVRDVIKVLLKTGEQLGNRANLILGEDGPWMELARSYMQKQPLQAQSLFAVLAQQGEAEFTRRRAHDALIELLFKADRKDLALQLYANQRWLSSVDTLSDASRYLLAEADMQQGKIRQAADLVKDLVRPPSGVDPLDWVLRRARLAVYAGDTATSIRLIGDYLQPLSQIGEGAAQRILQVLFDLQSVGMHRQVLQLFRALRQRIDSAQLQREMLFWMGDSRAALQELTRAAELYLGSALTGENSFDLWGQSARYKAAEALAKAGLVEDARRLYKSLLQATADAKRRLQLQRRLQELWLRKTT